ADGTLLVAWQPEKSEEKEIQPPATAAPQPGELPSNEELYLHGLHDEQYRHATYDPTDYYREALKRDPGDARNNNALGLWYLRRGKFAGSEPYFRRAVERLTLRNPNPCDGEPAFNLGCSLKFQGRYDEAYDTFYKSSWNAAWQDSAFFELARIDSIRGSYEEALRLIGQALARNANNPQMRHLKAALLRKTGRHNAAGQWLDRCIADDPFNYGCHFERYLLLSGKEAPMGERPPASGANAALAPGAAAPGANAALAPGAATPGANAAVAPDAATSGANAVTPDAVLAQMKRLMRDQPHTYIEYTLDYVHAGLLREAAALLQVYAASA